MRSAPPRAARPQAAQTGTAIAGLVADYLERQGVDRAALLAEVGLRPQDLAPGRRIPRAANQRLWALAAARTGDPALGLHIAQFAQPGALGLVEYLARTADSLLEAARKVAEFGRIHHDQVALRVVEEGERVLVVHSTLDGAPQPSEVVDFVLANLVVVGRELAGPGPGLEEVHLARPAPPDRGEYERFFRCRLRFGAPRSLLALDGERARAPLPVGDRRLHALLRRQAEQELAALPPADVFLAQVRAALRETLATAGGRADEVARRLGTSGRTLRRRLADHGTSHSALLDAVRRDLALQLEAGHHGPQIDVAVELGYASAAAYRRAFRRWTGTTPGRWRRRQGR